MKVSDDAIVIVSILGFFILLIFIMFIPTVEIEVAGKFNGESLGNFTAMEGNLTMNKLWLSGEYTMKAKFPYLLLANDALMGKLGFR